VRGFRIAGAAPVLALEGRRSKAQGERTREPWGSARNQDGAARDPRHAGRRPRVHSVHPGLYYDALPGLKRPHHPDNPTPFAHPIAPFTLAWVRRRTQPRCYNNL